MELAPVKCELSPRNHRLLVIDGSEVIAAKCVKRRRRGSSMSVLGGNEQQGEKLEEHKQLGTATTVKRSSRIHRETDLLGKFMLQPGAYNDEEAAARAYDLAALKYWGTSTFTNFPVSDYEKEIEIMKTVTKEEYLASLRRRSSGFSRGTQEEAARAYDIAAIEYRGINAVTNFDLSTYIRWLRPGTQPIASHDQKPGTDPQPFATSNSMQTRGNIEVSNSNMHSFSSAELDSTKKQDFSKYMNPLSPCNKPSSPTALGLLLKSTVFRELMQRNLNSSSEEGEEVELKYPQEGNDGNGGTYYSDNTSNSYFCSSDINRLPNLESPEESSLPMYHGTVQSLWNSDAEKSELL
ncbi:hypothetical protein LR48_Vigan01g102200 [Vigna angularis]|uniref:AP2/ERF domain-containing protein n=1 Tax=Phaseolus angularis TaxID=3914 RepID=A0A0L9TM10_PHAAN|nr:hypothetical protein LR48_Vigan01g102200 [Vigna angularis]